MDQEPLACESRASKARRLQDDWMLSGLYDDGNNW